MKPENVIMDVADTERKCRYIIGGSEVGSQRCLERLAHDLIMSEGYPILIQGLPTLARLLEHAGFAVVTFDSIPQAWARHINLIITSQSPGKRLPCNSFHICDDVGSENGIHVEADPVSMVSLEPVFASAIFMSYIDAVARAPFEAVQ